MKTFFTSFLTVFFWLQDSTVYLVVRVGDFLTMTPIF